MNINAIDIRAKMKNANTNEITVIIIYIMGLTCFRSIFANLDLNAAAGIAINEP